jgi:asparagine synthase (glutamine-hydrolysing)
MCGIAGLVTRGGVGEATLRRLASALAHRGPDGEGIFELAADGRSPFGIGLAHRRLAVLDPRSVGAQPMRSRSGRSVLVLNGEIYNHVQLRRRLPGFPWRTATDSEVLLELFEREGEALLPALEGIFAFAIVDTAARRIVLARDRLGVKPLFLRRGDDGGLVFGSELRTVLAAPGVSRRLDARAVSAYLDLGFVPAPSTMIEGVEKLAPGGLLVWQEGRAALSRWWTLPDADVDDAPRSWREGLWQRLVDAVRKELRSDVPVGCLLSGGVDSTLVTTLAVREAGRLPTFSVSFPEHAALDEGPDAAAVARALGTRHMLVEIRSADVGAVAAELVSSVDEPFADSSLLPTSVLARAARTEVTVALAGDGADELFAGYRRYRALRWLARLERVPEAMRRRLVAPLVGLLPDERTTRAGELGRRARKLLAAADLSPEAQALALARVVPAAEKLRLAPWLAPVEDAALASLRRLRAEARGRDELDTRLRVDLALGLPDDMLVKVDRASMSHGLEVRVPFLDARVVEHAARLPSHWKLRRGRSKAVLLDVFHASLPRGVRRRAKRGFDAPIGAWLRGPLRALAREALSPGALRQGGLLDPGAVDALLRAHDAGRADHAWTIWSLTVLSDWSRRHRVSAPAIADASAPRGSAA